MAIDINEVKETKILGENTSRMIPSKCKCGAHLYISNSLKELICIDDNCTEDLCYRTCNLVNKLSINLSEQSIRRIIAEAGLISPYQILLMQDIKESELVTSFEVPEIDDCILRINQVLDEEIELYNVVELSGIPEVVGVAYKLFRDFDNVDDAYSNIDKGQLVYINTQLGISGDASMFSIEIFNALEKVHDELIFAETLFKIKKHNLQYVNIAFADNIIPFVNKGELIDYLNNKYDIFRFRISTVSEDTDILIKNSFNNEKYRDARIINERYIEEQMNANELELSEIGEFVEGQLKPLGSKIYIDTLDNVIDRLEELYNT